MPRPRLAFILVMIFLDMAGFGMVASLLPLYVSRHAGGAVLAGALGSLYAAMQVLGAPLIGSLADRHGRRPVLVGCLLGSFTAYLALGFADSLAALFAAVAFSGLAGGSFATAQAYITNGSGPAQRTRWRGLAGAAEWRQEARHARHAEGLRDREAPGRRRSHVYRARGLAGRRRGFEHAPRLRLRFAQEPNDGRDPAHCSPAKSGGHRLGPGSHEVARVAFESREADVPGFDK